MSCIIVCLLLLAKLTRIVFALTCMLASCLHFSDMLASHLHFTDNLLLRVRRFERLYVCPLVEAGQ